MLHWIITVFGVIAVIYTARSAMYFISKPMPMWHVIGMSELCQCYLGFMTIAFSFLAATGLLEHTPDWVQQSMRISMFGILVYTTYRLRETDRPISTVIEEILDVENVD